jgi:hypothetical protein
MSQAGPNGPRIDAADAKALVDAGRAMVVNVDPEFHRPPQAIAGAARVAPDDVANRAAQLPPGCAVVTYCT